MWTKFERQKSDRQKVLAPLSDHGWLFIAQGLLEYELKNKLWEADFSSPDSVIGEPLRYVMVLFHSYKKETWSPLYAE